VLLGGGAQVLGTIVVAALADHFALGASTTVAVLAGALVALSSTAIILKLYTDRGELDTVHGRVVVAVLLAQDLCVVPLMLLLPVLAGTAAGPGGAGRTMLLALVAASTLVLGGRIVVPWVLARIADLRNRELFTLSVVCIGLGAAYLTSRFGLSLALGAFLAGLIIAESEYGLQALNDVLPFRDSFTGIFFTSVGMLLDLGVVARQALVVLALAAAIIVLKTFVTTIAVRMLRRSLHVALVSALALAQVGEFSFILAGSALALGLLAPGTYQLFLGASIVTMLAAPALVTFGEPIAEWITTRLLRRPAVEIPVRERHAVGALTDHVIIVGYGLNGRNLVRALESVGIPYVVLEQNGQNVRRARLERVPIYFGDGTRTDSLEHVGVAHARVVVFAISAPEEERRGVAIARSLAPDARIVVRTRYVREIDGLTRAGADEVVPEEFETSIEIFSRVLARYGIAPSRIRAAIDEARADVYGLLRADQPVRSRVREALAPLGPRVSLEVLAAAPSSRAAGESAASLRLRQTTGATVVAIFRDGTPIYGPDPSMRFDPGDEVALIGSAESLEKAAELFTTTDGQG
jgi:CPA2 family monovalent cation:H+ antiporter-2